MNIADLQIFFFRNMAVNFTLLILSTLAITLSGDFLYRMHSKFFTMEKNQFNTMMYGALLIYKILILVFAAVPWLVLVMM